MSRMIFSRTVSVALVVVLFGVIIAAQQTKKTIAPVPTQIVTAKKVFVSNAGSDAISQGIFERAGDPQQPYHQFYAAMKEWGRYELVNAPADADMIFEVRFSSPIASAQNTVYAPRLEVTILDAKTHFTLWTLGQRVQGAFRKKTWNRNFSDGMTRLMDDLKKLTTQPAVEASATAQQ